MQGTDHDRVDVLFSNRKPDIYKCDECDVFMKNCTEKIENMDSQQVASTFLGFLQRWAFTVFARSDAAATIYFIAQFCAASIREQLLIESGVY